VAVTSVGSIRDLNLKEWNASFEIVTVAEIYCLFIIIYLISYLMKYRLIPLRKQRKMKHKQIINKHNVKIHNFLIIYICVTQNHD